MSGSDMRATPPSRRMSAGTRSSAITAQAPASSAIFACSASTTSMITPPFSISARPLFTRIVPISDMRAMLPGQERLDGRPERLGLLEMDDVPCVLHDRRARRLGSPSASTAAAAGPQMKSSRPVITSVSQSIAPELGP